MMLLFPLFMWAQSGNEKKPLGAENYRDVYLSLPDTFAGCFGADSQSTYMKFQISGIKKGDSLHSYLLTGRSHHFNNESNFVIQPVILNTYLISKDNYIDTQHTSPKARRMLDSLEDTGWDMYFAEGNYTLSADTDKKNAGTTEGIFRITVLFQSNSNMVIRIPDEIRLIEPAIIFTGLWNPKDRKDINTPQFFCSLLPYINDKKEVHLPDFRMRPDGQVAADKWIHLRTQKQGKSR